jgi:hypothetical protein
MLDYLHLLNVGPAPEMTLHLAPRLNLITGDNGLGKSFLLDVAWWALTRRWPHDLNPALTSGYPAKPIDPKLTATITFIVQSKTKEITYSSDYSPRDEAWVGKQGRPWMPGLVLYAHADGGFSVWDPHRNYWKTRNNVDVQGHVPGYVFSPKEVWDGLEIDVGGKPTIVCNGLLRDWAGWIKERGPDAKRMADALKRLAPKGEMLEPARLVRLSINDARDIPSLRLPYADAVPILHASAGVRRIVALCYMLTWAWREHLLAAEQLGETPAGRLVLLFDEIESHLHPRWQRSILNAALALSKSLNRKAEIQLIAATHSPLVLASAEPTFDPEKDAWFDLDLDWEGHDRVVSLRRREFVRHGDASNWLTSEAFDLKSPRSLEAEDAIEQAKALLRRRDEPVWEDARRVDSALRKAKLSDIDPFWVRWGAFMEQLEGRG